MKRYRGKHRHGVPLSPPRTMHTTLEFSNEDVRRLMREIKRVQRVTPSPSHVSLTVGKHYATGLTI